MLNLIPVALQSTWDVYNNLRLNFRCYGLILETLETEVKNSRSALIELKLHRLKRANRTNCNYEFKTYKNTKHSIHIYQIIVKIQMLLQCPDNAPVKPKFKGLFRTVFYHFKTATRLQND